VEYLLHPVLCLAAVAGGSPPEVAPFQPSTRSENSSWSVAPDEGGAVGATGQAGQLYVKDAVLRTRTPIGSRHHFS